MGAHVKVKDKSMFQYSRNSLAAPLRRLSTLLDQVAVGNFDPDSTRSGYVPGSKLLRRAARACFKPLRMREAEELAGPIVTEAEEHATQEEGEVLTPTELADQCDDWPLLVQDETSGESVSEGPVYSTNGSDSTDCEMVLNGMDVLLEDEGARDSGQDDPVEASEDGILEHILPADTVERSVCHIQTSNKKKCQKIRQKIT